MAVFSYAAVNGFCGGRISLVLFTVVFFNRRNQIILSLSALWRPFLSNCIHVLFITLKIQFLCFEIKTHPQISLFSEVIRIFFISIEARRALFYPEIAKLNLITATMVHKDLINQVSILYLCGVITYFHTLCEAIFAL